MKDSIRNIYCVGRNYRAHAAELGNAVPAQPLIFTKPTHAVTPMDGGIVPLPGDRGAIHYEAELVLRIGKAYEAGMSVDELADGYALGLDFTLRDVQEDVKAAGLPWLPAKGFLGSAPLSGFRPFPGCAALRQASFQLLLNGRRVQIGHLDEMIFHPQAIVDFIGRHYGLGAGDIIYTGTPDGVGTVEQGDRLELLWGEEEFGAVVIG